MIILNLDHLEEMTQSFDLGGGGTQFFEPFQIIR